MKILHIITRMILGGAQRNTVLMCQAQIRAGHDVWLAHGPVYGPEGSLVAEGRFSGAQLVEIGAMRRAILPVHDLLCYRSLCRLIRRIKPDVVQTHSSKAGIVGRAAAWRMQVPAIVHTVHGPPFHDNQPALINRIYVAAERWAAQRCHKIICVSNAMRDAFVRHRVGRINQFEVVHNGFDIEDYARIMDAVPTRSETRRVMELPEEAPVIGVVGRLDRLKGQDDLLDVLPDLRRRFEDLHLLMVGDGWHGRALRARVEAMGEQGRVHFPGLVPLPRLVALLKAMDVMALPSYREGLPRTHVEALLCGCPVVGYDVDGVGEICRDGQTGILVSPGDRTGLGHAIERLLENKDLRQAMVERGQAIVRREFDLEVVASRTQRICEQLLCDPSGRN